VRVGTPTAAVACNTRRTAAPGAGRGGHRHHHLVDGVLAHDVGNLVEPPDHRDAVQAPVPLGGVVVDERDGAGPEPGVRGQFARHHRPGGAGPGDEHAPPRAVGRAPAPRPRRPVAPSAHHETRDGDRQSPQQPVEQQDRQRDARERRARDQPHAEADREPHRRQHRARGEQVFKVGLPRVPPEPGVQPHAPERDQPQR
jgi:hypothetical protein